MARIHAVRMPAAKCWALSPARAVAPEVRDIGRMIEEVRVSLWAQQIGTARPISASSASTGRSDAVLR